MNQSFTEVCWDFFLLICINIHSLMILGISYVSAMLVERSQSLQRIKIILLKYTNVLS